jgi:hypothetical protein
VHFPHPAYSGRYFAEGEIDPQDAERVADNLAHNVIAGRERGSILDVRLSGRIGPFCQLGRIVMLLSFGTS